MKKILMIIRFQILKLVKIALERFFRFNKNINNKNEIFQNFKHVKSNIKLLFFF